MKILHTGDWHLGPQRGPISNNQNLREKDTLKCLEELVVKAEEEKPELIIVAGDIFHVAKVWIERGTKEITDAYGYIKKLSKIADTVVLKGTPNHDGAEQFKMLKELLNDEERVHIVTKPEILNIGDVAITCIPGIDKNYYRSSCPNVSRQEENQALAKILIELMRDLKMKGACEHNILTSHYSVTGANTESGQTILFSENEPILQLSEIQEIGFDLICLGHIHRPQKIGNLYYCGAINQMNFNDEKQERGFYIHEVGEELKSTFIPSPIRQFKTIYLNDLEIKEINKNDFRSLNKVEINDSIVRVIFETDQEQSNLLNKATLAKHLLEEKGAFFVSDIVPSKVFDILRRSELSEKNTPEKNLLKYLEQNARPKERDEIMKVAMPVIEKHFEEEKSEVRGMMIPLEIEVNNYRNYNHGHFNFEDIYYANVTGENGAGKSSLFMDSIIDCLYESTREGNINGWLSNKEGVKSGSVSFTFSIADDLYRVVRSRTKSGKLSLSLSLKKDGDWISLSKEKTKDTQDEIIKIVGNCLSLKSSGLVMQDQYGVFLQTDNVDRMKILSDLLGLEVYEKIMESFKEEMVPNNKEKFILENKISMMNETISKGKEYEKEMIEKKSELELVIKSIDNSEKTKEILDMNKTHEKEIGYIESQIKIVNNEVDSLCNEKKKLMEDINCLEKLLSNKTEIIKGAKEVEKLEKEIFLLSPIKKEELLVQKKEIESYDIDILEKKKERVSILKKLEEKKNELSNKTLFETLVNENRKAMKEKTAFLSREKEFMNLSMTYKSEEKDYTNIVTAFENEYLRRRKKYKDFEKNRVLVETSGCKGKVSCPFINKAKEEIEEMKNLKNESIEWKAKEIEKIEEKKIICIEMKKVLKDLAFDPNEIVEIEERIESSKNAEKKLAKLEEVENQVLDLSNFCKKLELSIADMVKKMNKMKSKYNSDILVYKEYKEKAERLEENIKYKSLFIELKEALTRNTLLKEQVEKNTKNLSIKNVEMNNLKQEIKKINEKIIKVELIDGLEEKLTKDKERMKDLTKEIIKLELGLEEIQSASKEERLLRGKLEKVSLLLTHLSFLKNAFSYNGIPHQIAKEQIFLLEQRANLILSGMTYGKTSLRFKTEKIIRSGGKKEIPTLDVYINDDDITLPFQSKSGGERVKASLAAILALAEINAHNAVLQYGFLFIDEPPYLDESGIESYCDALENIKGMFPNKKILAITHEKSMAARFDQTIEIIKNEEGPFIKRR
ncbi:MAG: metallophosphoesterase [Eubacteriaceae bacterium]